MELCGIAVRSHCGDCPLRKDARERSGDLNPPVADAGKRLDTAAGRLAIACRPVLSSAMPGSESAPMEATCPVQADLPSASGYEIRDVHRKAFVYAG